VRRGAERIVVETARAMAARGHDVTILTAGAHRERAHDATRRVTTVRLRRRFSDNARHERWFGRAVLPRLVFERFDVVHSMMPYDAVAAIRAKRWRRHRTVYDEMGIPIKPWWHGDPAEKARLRIVRDVDVYGCMSQFALDALRRECGRDGVLIPGGVRLDEFRPKSEREPHPTVLFSAALDEPRKGLATLLDAVALLAVDEPDVRLWLSGPGDPTAIVAAAPLAARDRTTVLPLGAPGEQADRYASAWATALPSINDSFGVALIESLACGTPIVVADHSAPPEFVTPETGAVCQPGDAESLAAALRHAFALARDAATVARCRATARAFDWDDALAPHLEKIYTRD
jgi:glycosyltransferase involved in cell wall biosynthesis